MAPRRRHDSDGATLVPPLRGHHSGGETLVAKLCKLEASPCRRHKLEHLDPAPPWASDFTRSEPAHPRKVLKATP